MELSSILDIHQGEALSLHCRDWARKSSPKTVGSSEDSAIKSKVISNVLIT